LKNPKFFAPKSTDVASEKQPLDCGRLLWTAPNLTKFVIFFGVFKTLPILNVLFKWLVPKATDDESGSDESGGDESAWRRRICGDEKSCSLNLLPVRTWKPPSKDNHRKASYPRML